VRSRSGPLECSKAAIQLRVRQSDHRPDLFELGSNLFSKSRGFGATRRHAFRHEPDLAPNLLDGDAKVPPDLLDGTAEVSPDLLDGTAEVSPDFIDGIAEVSPDLLDGTAEVLPDLLDGTAEVSPDLPDSDVEVSLQFRDVSRFHSFLRSAV